MFIYTLIICYHNEDIKLPFLHPIQIIIAYANKDVKCDHVGIDVNTNVSR